MVLAERVARLSVADYLESEKLAEVKREYVAGQVFAMVGVSRAHNTIALNMAAALKEHLQGGPCQVFVADIKVRIDAADAFYYPDVVVTCDPTDTDEYYITQPSLVAEVLSPSTEGVDRREKLIAYQSLPRLAEYLLIAQDRVWIEIYRREDAGGWWHEAHGPGGQIRLESVKLTLNVDAIYRGAVK